MCSGIHQLKEVERDSAPLHRMLMRLKIKVERKLNDPLETFIEMCQVSVLVENISALHRHFLSQTYIFNKKIKQ